MSDFKCYFCEDTKEENFYHPDSWSGGETQKKFIRTRCRAHFRCSKRTYLMLLDKGKGKKKALDKVVKMMHDRDAKAQRDRYEKLKGKKDEEYLSDSDADESPPEPRRKAAPEPPKPVLKKVEFVEEEKRKPRKTEFKLLGEEITIPDTTEGETLYEVNFPVDAPVKLAISAMVRLNKVKLLAVNEAHVHFSWKERDLDAFKKMLIPILQVLDIKYCHVGMIELLEC